MCNCCRLAKCFRVGMRKELILTDAEKEARRQGVTSHRKRRKIIPKKEITDLVSEKFYLIKRIFIYSPCLIIHGINE